MTLSLEDLRRIKKWLPPIPSMFGMLHDVDMSTTPPTNGQVPVWNSTTKKFAPGAPSPIENVNTVSSSGSTYTIPDVTSYTMHKITLTANCMFTMPTATAGASFSLDAVQDGTGSRTGTFTGVKWAGGTAPTLSTAAGAKDDFAFVCFDGSTWHGFFAGKGMA